MIFTVLRKKCDKTECGNYHGSSLVLRVGEVPLIVVARRLGYYCEAKMLLPEEQCGFRTDRLTTNIIQEIGRKAEKSVSCALMFSKRFTTLSTALFCAT